MGLMQSRVARMWQYLVDTPPRHDIAAEEQAHRGHQPLIQIMLHNPAPLSASEGREIWLRGNFTLWVVNLGHRRLAQQ